MKLQLLYGVLVLHRALPLPPCLQEARWLTLGRRRWPQSAVLRVILHTFSALRGAHHDARVSHAARTAFR